MIEKSPIESKKLLTAIIDNMDAYVTVKDKNGRFVLANDNIATMLGTTIDEMIGKTDLDFNKQPKEIVAKFLADDLQVLTTLTPLTFEESIIYNDGTIHYLLTQKKPIRFENDEETYVFVFAMDITKQKLAEQAMHESDERYRMLFNTMLAGFVLFEVIFDEAGEPCDYRFLQVNPAYERMNEIRKKDLIGKTLREKFPNMDESYFDAYRSVILKGKETRLERYEKDLGKHFSIHAFKPENGKLAIMTRDITERKMMADALYTEKEYFRVTLQSLGDGVITTDGNQKLQLMNTAAEKMTGWSQIEARGKPFLEVFNISHEDPAIAIANPIEEALLKDRPCDFSNHAVLTSKDQIKRHVADSAAPIKDAQGSTTGVVMVFRDVTEKKRFDDDIKYLSYHDRLTGLYNRMYFEEEVKQVIKAGKAPLSIVMGDMNGLKLTNDLFGHLKGDALLKSIATIINKSCPDGCFAARWGGDEFVICLPGTDEAGAQDVIRSIQALCRKANRRCSDKVIVPSISLGCATKKDHSTDIYKTLEKAENNMYRTKLLESKNIHNSIINSIKNTVFEKSQEEQEHGQRIVYYCLKIGAKIKLARAKMDELELAAMMHDVGKITIQGSILSKQDKLNSEEWQEIKKHPEMGYRIARSSSELAGIADYILCHHERYDGKGYPQGLSKEDIPLLSRILAVADAYDAMTHPRPYKKIMSREEAKRELICNAGTQFDPDIVRTMMEVLDELSRSAKEASRT